jgi:hypothetical protein
MEGEDYRKVVGTENEIETDGNISFLISSLQEGMSGNTYFGK